MTDQVLAGKESAAPVHLPTGKSWQPTALSEAVTKAFRYRGAWVGHALARVLEAQGVYDFRRLAVGRPVEAPIGPMKWNRKLRRGMLKQGIRAFGKPDSWARSRVSQYPNRLTRMTRVLTYPYPR
jgi:hypothetical protein